MASCCTSCGSWSCGGGDCLSKNTPLYDLLPDCCVAPAEECASTPAILSGCTFTLDAGEQGIFDCWAAEHTDTAGVGIELWHYNLEASSRDPLYDETIDRVFEGAYKFKSFVEFPEKDPEVTEHGFKIKWDASIWIPRANLEATGAPVPTEHDVVRIWNTPFYKNYSVADQNIPGSGYFFNVIKADADGQIFNTPNFVGFKCMLKRNTEYTPERRMASD